MTLPSRITDADLAELPLDAGLDVLLAELLDQAPAERRRWPLVVAAAASVAAVVAVPTLVLRDAPEPATPLVTSGPATTSPSQDPASSILVLPPEERGRPVDLSGTTLDGERLDLADLRGEEVVLHVWGSWCVPCREDLADLAAVAPTLGARIVGLDVRDTSRQNARAAVRSYDVPYPSIELGETDLGSVPGLARLGTVAAPTTIVLDTEGRVATVISGRLPRPGLLDSFIGVPDLPDVPDVLTGLPG